MTSRPCTVMDSGQRRRRTTDGTPRAASCEPGALLHLEELESALVESLTTQMIDLVGVDSPADEDPLVAMVGIDPGAAPSEDPALLRLLPDAYPDDDDASSEFRRFTERDLRSAKVPFGCGSPLLLVRHLSRSQGRTSRRGWAS